MTDYDRSAANQEVAAIGSVQIALPKSTSRVALGRIEPSL